MFSNKSVHWITDLLKLLITAAYHRYTLTIKAIVVAVAVSFSAVYITSHVAVLMNWSIVVGKSVVLKLSVVAGISILCILQRMDINVDAHYVGDLKTICHVSLK